MAGRRHTPEQIIRKLAEGQKLLAGGMDVGIAAECDLESFQITLSDAANASLTEH